MKKNNLSNCFLLLLTILLVISSACVEQKITLTALVKNEANEPAIGLKSKLQNRDKFQGIINNTGSVLKINHNNIS